MLRWLKRVVLGLVALVGVAIVSGIAFEHWSRWSVAREYPPPGQLVDVNGRKLHLNCSGSGEPTVILEHGWTYYGSVSWVLVQPEIAKSNRVCSYDRAGNMWSDRRKPVPVGVEIIEDLRSALEGADESPPYILVGHSFGGVIMRIFADKYPAEVVGLVFVDSSHPDQTQRYADLFDEEVYEAPWWEPIYSKVIAHTSVMRLLELGVRDKIPREAAFAHEFFPQIIPGVLDEGSTRVETDEQARGTGPFGDIPIIVLTARPSLGPSEEQSAELTAEEIEEWRKDGELWYQLHNELAALSTVSDHRIVEGSEHRIPFQAPGSIVQAVRDAVAMSMQAGEGTEN
jgi:pimeloyl-ACP methyl ester carboxylesterase